MDAPASLSRLLPEIEAALRRAVPGDLAVDRASRYVLGWQDEHGGPAETGGKRIRPALCLIASEAVGGSRAAAMPGAVAIELIHNFSLVHDDIQDRDHERHHRPTAWRIWGEAQAINLGDYLITAALSSLLRAHLARAEARVAALDAVNAAVARMIEGQWADLAFESRVDIAEGDYVEMVRGKTGALLGACLATGAILGGAPPGTPERLAAWGELVGLAFQARDDYLGIWGDAALTGKSTTNDLWRRKKSLPVVLGLADERSRQAIANLFGSGEPDDSMLRDAVAALDGIGAGEATMARAEMWRSEADGILSGLELRPAPARELAAFADFAVRRLA